MLLLLLLQMQLMRTTIVVTKTMIVVVIIVVVVVVVVEKVMNHVKKINVKGVIMKTVKTTIVMMAKAVLTKISHPHQAQLT